MNLHIMRAKMTVSKVDVNKSADNVVLNAVARSDGYPNDGFDEDNTYAKFSPSGSLSLSIANPELFGKIRPGQTFYIDFTPVPEATPPAE